MKAAEMKALARKFFDIYNENKAEEIDRFYASNFVNHDPAHTDLPKGRETMRQILKIYRTAFPDSRFTVEQQIVEGDLVATRWTSKGTHKGPLRDIAPTNKKINLSGLTLSRISGNKIVESWSNWDTLGMLQQIGAVPQPKKTAAR